MAIISAIASVMAILSVIVIASWSSVGERQNSFRVLPTQGQPLKGIPGLPF